VNLTQSEHQIIEKAALKAGTPVAAFIRAAALADAGWTVHAGVHHSGAPRSLEAPNKEPVGDAFLSARCRNKLLVHAQGHARDNKAGFTDEALLRSIWDKTCVELLEMHGVGEGTIVELRRQLREHGLALRCGCPQTPCPEYTERAAT